MATAKKKFSVAKTKLITVQRLGTRTRRDLIEELETDLAAGYRVASHGRAKDGVQICLTLDQGWTVDELVSEVEEMLVTLDR